MAAPRFYCPLPLAPGRSVILPEAVSRHAFGALRLRVGDAVILFNGDGSDYAGILGRDGQGARVELRAGTPVTRESPLEVTLIQGVSSGERMDFTLQKAVELGVSAIQPVIMQRTVVRLDEQKRPRRHAHWQGVVMAACEQCGRAVLPEVGPIRDFPDWLAEHRAAPARKLILDPQADQGLADLPRPEGPVWLLVGPEGGFDPAERRLALDCGFTSVRLGPRILRTETAALATLAAMQALWGDF
jgi:16S rRNA (uracil1498-N3)-methyltransferase